MCTFNYLSTERLHKTHDKNEPYDKRTDFQKDYHSIISSSAFRRLQDKTQVFPLDKSDYVRTRLTHSLEVASIGRSLVQSSCKFFQKKKTKQIPKKFSVIMKITYQILFSVQDYYTILATLLLVILEKI